MKKIVLLLLLLFVVFSLISCEENSVIIPVPHEVEYWYGHSYDTYGDVRFRIKTNKPTYQEEEVITIEFKCYSLGSSNYNKINEIKYSILENEYFEIIGDKTVKKITNSSCQFKVKTKKASHKLFKLNIEISGKYKNDYKIIGRNGNDYKYLCPIYFISDELGTYFAGIGEIVEKDNSYLGNVFHFQNRLNELYNKGIIDKEEYINRLVNNYKNSLFGYYVSPNLSFKINFTNENYDKFKYLLSLEEYLYLAYETNNLTLEEFNSELKNYQSLVYNYNYLMFYTDLLPFEITNSDLDKMAFNDSDYINGYYVINNKVVGKVNDNYKYDFTFDYNGYPFGLSEDYIWE